MAPRCRMYPRWRSRASTRAKCWSSTWLEIAEQEASMFVECETDVAGGFPQRLRVRGHTFQADVGPSSGGTDSAPSADADLEDLSWRFKRPSARTPASRRVRTG